MATEGSDPKKTALLMMEFQNDVVSEKGAFAFSGAPTHARQQNVIANVSRLADAMRQAGSVVVHVHYVVEPDARGLKLNAPLFRSVPEYKGLVRGAWGTSPVDGMEPQPGDYVVEKLRMNAFYGTRLAPILEGCGIETLVITGGWTNFSVEHTARHGADAGYQIIVATDGTFTINDEWQKASMDYAMQNIAVRLSCDEILRTLSG